MQIQQPGPYLTAPGKHQQRIQHAFSSWIGMLLLVILTVVLVGGGLAWLQWSSQHAITLGYPVPQVHITTSLQGSIAPGQQVQFTAHAVGRDLTYSWYFQDDQSTASGPVVAHAFQTYGNIAVSVDVEDAIGRTSSDSTTVNVLPAPPTATFTSQEETAYYGGYNQTVDFDASGSTVNTSTVTYNWDFGDGNQDSTSSPTTSHYYYYTGQYNVVLTVVDAANQQSTYTQTIYVQ